MASPSFSPSILDDLLDAPFSARSSFTRSRFRRNPTYGDLTLSAASIFVSRMDAAVDRALNEIGSPDALALRGKVAIANARVIYARFRDLFYGARFAALRLRGVRVQRVLWGRTGTKNAAY